MDNAKSAADEAALDGDFLDYLGALEGDEEDWTWFSEEAPGRPQERTPPSDDALEDPR